MTEKKPLNVAIGKRIQFSRERAGFTQEQLAERIDRSTQFISTIERGVAGPSLETIISLSEKLNVSCDWLLRGQHSSQIEAESVTARLANLSAAQLAAFDRIVTDLLALVEPEK